MVIQRPNQPDTTADATADVTVDVTAVGTPPAELAGEAPATGARPGWRRRPATVALIAVNVLVAAIGLVLIAAAEPLTSDLVLFDGISVLHEQGEMSGAAVNDGQVWRLLTSMFVHYGLGHLVVNMVMLCLVGWRLERVLGSTRFVTMYLACGLVAGVATYVFSHGSLTAGASGANFGAFAALMVLAVWLRLPKVLPGVLLGIGVGMTFALPGIAVAAHVAGLLAGAALAGWYAYRGGASRPAGDYHQDAPAS